MDVGQADLVYFRKLLLPRGSEIRSSRSPVGGEFAIVAANTLQRTRVAVIRFLSESTQFQ
jgi:hypothetical protein